jgi:hypothetical protein
MLDIAYVVTTVVFFGAMIAYAHGCEALGRDGTRDGAEP